MDEEGARGEPVDVQAAMRQYNRVKTMIESLGTEVLEIPPDPNCQDQSYTANIGVSFQPMDVIVSRFSAAGRPPEEAPAIEFFQKLGCRVQQSPHWFEGEADLKWIRDNLYFGGSGMFSDRYTYEWMMDNYDVQIIPLRIIDPGLYHLDCSIFVLDGENIICTPEALDPVSVKELQQYVNPIFTKPEHAKAGITNVLKVPHQPVVLWEEEPFDKHEDTKRVMEWYEEVLDQFGLVLVTMSIDKFAASGADLSCMVMHLEV
jgi:N-dimethylarginine dimethylaminohydrolase